MYPYGARSSRPLLSCFSFHLVKSICNDGLLKLFDSQCVWTDSDWRELMRLNAELCGDRGQIAHGHNDVMLQSYDATTGMSIIPIRQMDFVYRDRYNLYYLTSTSSCPPSTTDRKPHQPTAQWTVITQPRHLSRAQTRQ